MSKLITLLLSKKYVISYDVYGWNVSETPASEKMYQRKAKFFLILEQQFSEIRHTLSSVHLLPEQNCYLNTYPLQGTDIAA